MKKVALIIGSLTFCILVLFLFEIGIRLFKPEINNQDTELSLFRENAFGNSVGWKPNSSGISFGKQVLIDEYGFRKISSPAKYNSSWLIMGDSVTFGVGVDTQDLFVEKLQKNVPTVKLWNTSVVGYSLNNYKDVLNHFLATRQDIQKVIMFFTLNDIYGYLNVNPVQYGYWKRISFYLKQNSKFYMLSKNLLFDRSRTYFLHDFNLYNQSNPKFRKSMDIIDDMSSILKQKEIDFIVVLLPYEYQIRMKRDDYLKPQKLVIDELERKNIPYIDAYDYLKKAVNDSRELYLYADAMHFSRIGHEAVFNLLMSKPGGASRVLNMESQP
jgi:lysophospholipase L1-like esterase